MLSGQKGMYPLKYPLQVATRALPPVREPEARSQAHGRGRRGGPLGAKWHHAVKRGAGSRLYRATHATFEAYCQEQWGMRRSTAYQYIEAAATVERLSANADIPPGNIPANEAQARALSQAEPDDQAIIWQTVTERTASHPWLARRIATYRHSPTS